MKTAGTQSTEPHAENVVRSPSCSFKSTSACGLFLSCPPVRNNHSILLLTLQGIVGNLSSGKSALVHRYLTGTYVQEESPEGKLAVGRVGQQVMLNLSDTQKSPNILIYSGSEELKVTWQDMSIFSLRRVDPFFPVHSVALGSCCYFTHQPVMSYMDADKFLCLCDSLTWFKDKTDK